MKAILVLVAATLLFVACSPARMALEGQEWQNKEPLAVSGKKGLFTRERMQFGEYRTKSVKRSWTRGAVSSWGLGVGSNNDYTALISMEYIQRKQTIQFSMTDKSDRESLVFCVSHFNAEDLSIGNRPNSILNIGLDLAGLTSRVNSNYYVQLYAKKTEQPWEMLIDNVQSQGKPKSYVGYLSHNKTEFYSIHPVYKMEGRDGRAANILFGMVGFEFRNPEGKPVAAVSLLNKGVVYLQPLEEEKRFLLANACAALLMQEQIG